MANVGTVDVSYYTKIHAMPTVSKANVQGKIAGSSTPTIPPELDKKKQWMDYRMKIIRADMTRQRK